MPTKNRRNSIDIDNWRLAPYITAMRKYPFDCGVEDLNSFFERDIEKYDRELIAKTFILTPVGVRFSRSNPPQPEKERCFKKLKASPQTISGEPETVAMYYDLRRTMTAS